jgi:hypothetical protein
MEDYARVWGKDVVANAIDHARSPSSPAPSTLAAEIFDREDATVRVAEQHADFFARNLVAILAEERLALAIYRTAVVREGQHVARWIKEALRHG